MMEIITHADWDDYTYEIRANGRTFFASLRVGGWGFFEVDNPATAFTHVGERFDTVSAVIERIEQILAA